MSAAADRQSWQEFDTKVLGAEGALAQVHRLQVDSALTQATELAQTTLGRPPAHLAARFQEALAASQAYLNQLKSNQVPAADSLAWPDLAAQFPAPESAEHQEGRLALLAMLHLQEHLRQAQRYLQNLDAKNPQSGTGDQAYLLDGLELQTLADQLEQSQAAWCKFLGRECEAASLMSKGLRCLSTHRNQQAATMIQRILKEHPQTLVLRRLH
jgi:hypothetical protein